MARRAFHLASRRRQRRANGHAARELRIEPLESRHMLATFLVTNLGDASVTAAGDAPGTLRQAIYDANHSTHSDDPDLIQFTGSLTGDINLSVADDLTFGPSALVITSKMRIEGNGHPRTIKRDTSTSNLRLFVVAPGAELSIDSLMLSGGAAQGSAGAPGQNGGDGLGGAIYNQGSTTFIATTLYNNTAIAGLAGSGGTYGLALGGAVYNDGGTLSIHNSTLSGNSTSSAGGPATNARGGAVYSRNGTLNVYNSTITDNAARSGRDLYIIAESSGTATVNIYSSIVARADANLNFLDILTTYDQNVQQLSVNGANNLLRRHSLPFDFAITTDDPLLGPLGDNGGPTLTHALLSNSPAFGLGSNPFGFTTDQRGASNGRAFFGRIDIGAFELQSLVGPAPAGDYNRNHSVDAADYVAWRKTIGNTVPQFSGADGNGNMQIDPMDYLVWRSQFGATSAPPAPIATFTANATNVETAAQPAQPLDKTMFRDAALLGWYTTQTVHIVAVPDALPADAAPNDPTASLVRDTALLAILANTASAKPGSPIASASRTNESHQPTCEEDAPELSALLLTPLGQMPPHA